MIVSVEHILSEREFGVIFAGRVIDEASGEPGEPIRVRAFRHAMLGSPSVGERWRIDGWTATTRWGPQINVVRAVRSLPSGTLVRTFLADHVPGIGQDRADRLWAAYGTSLPNALLDGDLDELAKIVAPDRPLLGPRIAAAAVRAWREADAQTRLVVWLQDRGVEDMRVAARIHAVLGSDAVQTLSRNPWCLVSLLPWKTVDDLGCRILREAGEPSVEDAPSRLVGAVDAAMKDVIATGDTLVGEAALKDRVARKLDVPVNHARVEQALVMGQRNGAALLDGVARWRAPGCALMEEAVVGRLRSMRDDSQAEAGRIEAAEWASALDRYESGVAALHPEQRAAVLQILTSPFACLRGGAGVGKTHVTRAICHVWETCGGDVVLAALAGKAALRLSRATGKLARTLFRLLGELDERSRFASQSSEGVVPLGTLADEARLAELAEITPRSLVIVDEASMLDVATIYALLRRMPVGARLLLVGDERQLPPIGFGLVFHRIVVDAQVTANLTVIHRQRDDSGIPALAAAVRKRQMPALRSYSGVEDGVSLLEAKDVLGIEDGVKRAFRDLAADDTLVIAPMRRGGGSVRCLNDSLHEVHVASWNTPEMVSPLGDRFCIGEPVLHGRNDYKRGLWNGSLGKVLRLGDGVMTADFEGEEHQFARDELIDLTLGYALTCHRAQGSQARRVIVALTPSRLLDPSWLYTALTRAERQVVLVGDPTTIHTALASDWAADRRFVGFCWR
ncbi:AAA family ATPase [Methylobacterium radiotolerans]|jgi:exodeoxyribonuclease V alpha subunit|uniref:AAA family ATPase n=1 Tax=Methylobacterium radiotolerans TaxID=31998 RepID=UPI0038D20EE5